MTQVLCTLYMDPSAGQLGVTKTLKLGEDVENHIRRCDPCAEVNDLSKQPKVPLINVKAGHPLQRVAIVIVGPTPMSTSGHEWLPVVSDHFTKFCSGKENGG